MTSFGRFHGGSGTVDDGVSLDTDTDDQHIYIYIFVKLTHLSWSRLLLELLAVMLWMLVWPQMLMLMTDMCIYIYVYICTVHFVLRL